MKKVVTVGGVAGGTSVTRERRHSEAEEVVFFPGIRSRVTLISGFDRAEHYCVRNIPDTKR